MNILIVILWFAFIVFLCRLPWRRMPSYMYGVSSHIQSRRQASPLANHKDTRIDMGCCFLEITHYEANISATPICRHCGKQLSFNKYQYFCVDCYFSFARKMIEDKITFQKSKIDAKFNG